MVDDTTVSSRPSERYTSGGAATEVRVEVGCRTIHEAKGVWTYGGAAAYCIHHTQHSRRSPCSPQSHHSPRSLHSLTTIPPSIPLFVFIQFILRITSFLVTLLLVLLHLGARSLVRPFTPSVAPTIPHPLCPSFLYVSRAGASPNTGVTIGPKGAVWYRTPLFQAVLNRRKRIVKSVR